MMPTIRIDDDVFEGLKALAEPFTDTPNTVIRRLLDRHAASAARPMQQPTPKASPVSPSAMSAAQPTGRKTDLTPQHVYEQYLLHSLATDFNGSAEKHDVTTRVIQRMKASGWISPVDLELVSSGETRAENTIAWGRNALKDRGLISRHSKRGLWELTSEGKAEGAKLALSRKG